MLRVLLPLVVLSVITAPAFSEKESSQNVEHVQQEWSDYAAHIRSMNDALQSYTHTVQLQMTTPSMENDIESGEPILNSHSGAVHGDHRVPVELVEIETKPRNVHAAQSSGSSSSAPQPPPPAEGGGSTNNNPTYILPVDPFNYYPFFNGFSNVNPFSQFYPPGPSPSSMNQMATAQQSLSSFGNQMTTPNSVPPFLGAPAGNNPQSLPGAAGGGAGAPAAGGGAPTGGAPTPGTGSGPLGSSAPPVPGYFLLETHADTQIAHNLVEPVMLRPLAHGVAGDDTYTMVMHSLSDGYDEAPSHQTCVNCRYR